MAKDKWDDRLRKLVRDDKFVRNFLIIGTLAFVMIGITVLYNKNQLELEHYKTSLDIAIGIVVGTGILKLLNKNG